MVRNYSAFLWMLKLGALVNLYFFIGALGIAGADPFVAVPAELLFAVSGYRCLFPVRYEHNIVFHDSIFSSIFVTRVLATFSEVAYIFMFSHVLRVLNVNQVEWIIVLSWLMVAQVVISQCLVWSAILLEDFELYFWEETGWFFIYAVNAIASFYLVFTINAVGGRGTLLILNLIFGALYLPWQILNLRGLRAEAREQRAKGRPRTGLNLGLRRAMFEKNRRTDSASWGGTIGLTWMTAYWATLIPFWTYYIVKVLAPR